jgi:hypothetical protein
MVIKGLYPEVIPGKEEGAANTVPKAERKNPVKSVDTLLPPLFVSVDDHFSIRSGHEPVIGIKEFFPKLDVIIDLPIEYDVDVAVLIGDRLSAPVNIDDAQSAVPHPDVA